MKKGKTGDETGETGETGEWNETSWILIIILQLLTLYAVTKSIGFLIAMFISTVLWLIVRMKAGRGRERGKQ